MNCEVVVGNQKIICQKKSLDHRDKGFLFIEIMNYAETLIVSIALHAARWFH